MLARDPTPDHLDEVLQSIQDAAAVVSADHRIVAANEAFRIAFADGEDPCGCACHAVTHGFARPCGELGISCPLDEACRTGHAARACHAHPHARAGVVHPCVEEVVALPLTSPDGGPRHHLEIMRPLYRTAPPLECSLVGRSIAFQQVLDLVNRVAPTELPVLLRGESGTGKELVAHAIHALSGRAGGPFVALECAGLSSSLVESELFGHERGAFTGAVAAKKGLVECSDGGTLFLDEVGDVPPAFQVKLLRLLESGEYRPVGGVRARQATFRLVCATNQDLDAMVHDGRFRLDLLHRINTLTIELPPLRSRPADIRVLAEHFASRLPCAGACGCRLDEDVVPTLMRCDLPGNARELRNALAQACVLGSDGRISSVHLPKHLRTEASGRPPGTDAIRPLCDVSDEYLLWAAASHAGDHRTLAAALGISERTLYRRLRAARGRQAQRYAR